jgi:predicted lipid-binding transport protein (Tim44 family)
VSNQVLEILILAVVAAVVIGRLFSVLGQRRGSEGPAQPPPQPQPRPAPVEVGAGQGGLASPIPTPAAPPGAPGVAAVMQADPGFDPAEFLAGARAAYEMIVSAFATGDRATLQPLLNPRVYEAYDRAISDREAGGGKGPELVRLKSAELADARMEGDVARVAVRFEAELAEGAVGLRDTKERWTFERDVRSRDPNWRLSAVAQA